MSRPAVPTGESMTLTGSIHLSLQALSGAGAAEPPGDVRRKGQAQRNVPSPGRD